MKFWERYFYDIFGELKSIKMRFAFNESCEQYLSNIIQYM